MQSDFSALLQTWYREHKRSLPWRDTKDPYLIWVSEIIMQQTRVAQGLPYYEKFVFAYPRVSDLATAAEDGLMRLWQGLGYYSRARNMQFAARQVMETFAGVFPHSHASIKSLKGVGDYTAAAISSFAFGLPHAVVDGNVMRFLSRLTGSSIPINTARGKAHFQSVATALLDTESPADHNQAMMEFGSLQCRPARPLCATCIFQSDCVAFRDSLQDQLPVKEKSKAALDRYFNYIDGPAPGQALIYKRKKGDIWEGLYDFMLFESVKPLEVQEFMASESLSKLLDGKPVTLRGLFRLPVHVLSHQRIHASFWKLDFSEAALQACGTNPLSREELTEYPMPRLMTRYLEEDEVQNQINAICQD